MGFYENQVLPRAIDVMLGSKAFGREIRGVASEGLHGDVIELGFGSGLNLPYYPPEVTGVWTVDPSAVGMKLAQKRIAASPVPVHEGGRDGARLDFPDDRFDAALSTMTLCTIPDAAGALAEVRRVLKPEASLHFAEHGLAPDDKVARFQHRFDPWQQRLAGGCHLARDMRALLTDAGFEIEELVTRYIKGPKAWSYMYIGRARNPA
jgi:SAM-dependent methyltransferase